MSEGNTTDRTEQLKDQYPVLTRPTRQILGDKQLDDYEQFRLEFINWLDREGKTPEVRGENGYAEGVVSNTAHRIDYWFRYVWEQEGSYTLNITHDHAEMYMDHLAYEQQASKSHGKTTEIAVKRYFKWRHHERGGEEWSPSKPYPGPKTITKPADYLTADERPKIREAALEYGETPHYKTLDPEERDKWKAYLAQVIGKPKSEVTPRDFAESNGWKVPSLAGVSLDAGLRPKEVARATVEWVDVRNEQLRIPREESTKNENNWKPALTSRTARWLANWIKERENYPKYDDTDALWLTREGNEYSSQSLRYLLHKLCDEAGIPYEHRKMSWYSLRHSVGTYMTEHRDLKAAQSQLRHNSPRTTMQYDGVSTEQRRDALDKMG
ncbi:tyrosine-type recombinase/integrase [Haloplanus natans]|uniref:tyrosine-type recombinase/integrase n=1 Tax=Haloplanus natans TaxID=376171 RepID=UPI0006781ECD|nr:site-specific integrase [Haloplanus natans]